jgi:hypothetical protein
LEYRKKNTSASWTRANEMVNGDQRVYLLRADLFEPEAAYEFRVYAYAKKFSEPAYASKTYVIGKTRTFIQLAISNMSCTYCVAV